MTAQTALLLAATLLNCWNMNDAVTCENKQVAITFGGWESVTDTGGQTCEDNTYCMKKRMETTYTFSLVTQCANVFERELCDKLPYDTCWQSEPGIDDEPPYSDVCCCKTHMCNQTPYIVGLRPENNARTQIRKQVDADLVNGKRDVHGVELANGVFGNSGLIRLVET